MKTLSLLFFLLLLLASGACDGVKYISKRNSGRMNRLSVCYLEAHFKLKTFLCLHEVFFLSVTEILVVFVVSSFCFTFILSLLQTLSHLLSNRKIMPPLVFPHLLPLALIRLLSNLPLFFPNNTLHSCPFRCIDISLT